MALVDREVYCSFKSYYSSPPYPSSCLFICRDKQPPVAVSPGVLRERREWLVAAVARELEPAFRAHTKHLRSVSYIPYQVYIYIYYYYI